MQSGLQRGSLAGVKAGSGAGAGYIKQTVGGICGRPASRV